MRVLIETLLSILVCVVALDETDTYTMYHYPGEAVPIADHGKRGAEFVLSMAEATNGLNHAVSSPDLPCSTCGTRPISPIKQLGMESVIPCKSMGLKNQGVTCHMNAALQVLLHLTPVILYFQDSAISAAVTKVRRSKDSELSARESLVKYLSLTHDSLSYGSEGATGPATAYDPLRLSLALQSANADLSMRFQQDSQETLSFLIDSLDEYSKKVYPSDARGQFFGSLFQARVSTSTLCQRCASVSSNIAPASTVQLSFPKKRTVGIGPLTISEMMTNYVSVEPMRGDNQYACCSDESPLCTGHCPSDAVKVARFVELPKLLILQLNRFAYNREMRQSLRVNDSVSIPMMLDMLPYMHKDFVVPHASSCYDLVGVIHHAGRSSSSGHYIADYRNPIQFDEWIHANDAHVEAKSEVQMAAQLANSKTAYVLVYQQRQ